VDNDSCVGLFGLNGLYDLVEGDENAVFVVGITKVKEEVCCGIFSGKCNFCVGG